MKMLLALALTFGSATFLAAYPPVGKEKEKADPRETVEGAIGEMIRMTEAKEYKKFIETFCPPDELEQIKKNGGIDAVVERMKNSEKTERMLSMLKEIKDQKPAMSDDGKTASFKVKEGRNMSFAKIGKYWYAKD